MATTKSSPRSKAAPAKPKAESNGTHKPARLAVQKTYKIYINGAFPRTESGRYLTLTGSGGFVANVCNSSRKDFRDAVVAARAAWKGWSGRAHFNRGQILYRIAEMLEGRRAQFVQELMLTGASAAQAEREVNASIDRLVYYAGWADKYQQVFSSVNAVASSHFNFSLQESMGVVAMVLPEENGLLGLVSAIAPAIAGGNVVVALASESHPLCAISFGEVLNSSDVPAGVVNLLTGQRSELLPHFASHMDVNALVLCSHDAKEITLAQQKATVNVKRVVVRSDADWFSDSAQGPYQILDLQEIKTTWHPVGV
jgi:acyl-CoA reductase-like NAD-dependent aldehyde dehydrogenase